jgi:hypothetical protein
VGRNELSSITLDILTWISAKGSASIESYYDANLWRMGKRELEDTLVVLTRMGKIRTESQMLPDGRLTGTIFYIDSDLSNK